METLDIQLKEFETFLKNEIGITDEFVLKIATTIKSEIQDLSITEIENIMSHSPINLNNRFDELICFQRMMDFVRVNKIKEPGIIRSQLITQNYICFVYLKDSYFKAIQKEAGSNTIIHRCCNFLTSAHIRKFRNAIAHGNWSLKADGSGLEYWDYKNGRRNNGFNKFEVGQIELNFWQTFSRVVAYSTIETITEKLQE